MSCAMVPPWRTCTQQGLRQQKVVSGFNLAISKQQDSAGDSVFGCWSCKWRRLRLPLLTWTAFVIQTKQCPAGLQAPSRGNYDVLCSTRHTLSALSLVVGQRTHANLAMSSSLASRLRRSPLSMYSVTSTDRLPPCTSATARFNCHLAAEQFSDISGVPSKIKTHTRQMQSSTQTHRHGQ